MSVCLSIFNHYLSHSFEARKLKIGKNNTHINVTKPINQFLIFCLEPEIFEVKNNRIALVRYGLSA